MSDLVIRHPDGDVAIEDGVISAIGPELAGGKAEFDAAGLCILPGLIDVHVHFNEPGRTEWEGAATGSRALAAGGGTIFFDMPLNSSPCTLTGPDFDAKRAALEAASITDFALWGGLVPGNLAAMVELAERGVIGFKAFLCDSGLPEFPAADDLTLYEGMREAARLGLPVAVHAESEALTKALRGRATVRDAAAYVATRPVIAEVEAIERAALFARETGCRLHVVHVSSAQGVLAALAARARGTDISIETCPHYLAFSEKDLLEAGASLKCAPPLRTESLWSFVRDGSIDIVASDHSPCPPEMKAGEDFFAIWGGIAGVQATMPVLSDGGLPPEQIAKLTAANPARRFGLSNRGSVAVGYRADLCLMDLRASARHEPRFQRHYNSPYAGRTFRGVVKRTYRGGDLIFADGAITARTMGAFVRCTT